MAPPRGEQRRQGAACQADIDDPPLSVDKDAACGRAKLPAYGVRRRNGHVVATGQMGSPGQPRIPVDRSDRRSRILLAPELPVPVEVPRSEEHTYELQSLMRNSYAVFCLK